LNIHLVRPDAEEVHAGFVILSASASFPSEKNSVFGLVFSAASSGFFWGGFFFFLVRTSQI